MSDFDKAALVALCWRIQNNPDTIPVRVNLDGKTQNLFLSEMPASLAVWWAMHFVLTHLIDGDGTPPPADAKAENAA